MKVVAVQMNMAWEDKSANHLNSRRLLADAEVAPGSLVIFPEMFETGFSMDTAVTAQSKRAEGERLLRELAAEHDCAVMGGVAAPAHAGVSANHCVVFAPDGTELCRYQKMQPFTLTGEDKHYPAGDTWRIFEWQGVKIAPFICYDLRFPEIFRPAIAGGAEMITLIACWPAVRSEHWVRLLQARAIENLCPVVGVNRCGEEVQLKFDGRSCAFNHLGECLFEADEAEQTFETAIDIEAARRWRAKFPALRDMRMAAENTASSDVQR